MPIERKRVTRFITSDGKGFDTLGEATEHEKRLMLITLFSDVAKNGTLTPAMAADTLLSARNIVIVALAPQKRTSP